MNTNQDSEEFNGTQGEDELNQVSSNDWFAPDKDNTESLFSDVLNMKADKSKPTARVSTLADFKILKKLGEGTYSIVYKVTRIQDGKVYSLKKVRIIEGLSDKERQNSINEVRILASITKNQNVIRYYEAFMDQTEAETHLCVVMEYADGGDLF